jgi:hypothetical protein
MKSSEPSAGEWVCVRVFAGCCWFSDQFSAMSNFHAQFGSKSSSWGMENLSETRQTEWERNASARNFTLCAFASRVFTHWIWENSLFFGVVVTTERVSTRQGKNRTTNCRWNNFGNVVHSVSVINDFDDVVDAGQTTGAAGGGNEKSRVPLSLGCTTAIKIRSLISTPEQSKREKAWRTFLRRAFYTQWTINACASPPAPTVPPSSGSFEAFLPGVRKQFNAFQDGKKGEKQPKTAESERVTFWIYSYYFFLPYLP